jgi:beta-galactosidase/beta-glucuronidase
MELTQRLLWASLSLLHVLGTSQGQTDGKPTPYKVQQPPLDTDWTYKVGTNPWPQHPRPQLRREDWINLNGIWTYENVGEPYTVSDPPAVDALSHEIMIPSCVESGLSGVQDLNATNMWFTRSIKVPDTWKGQDVMLHFEAVDYEATVFLNGKKVGEHVGGYTRFTVDITEGVKWNEENKL